MNAPAVIPHFCCALFLMALGCQIGISVDRLESAAVFLDGRLVVSKNVSTLRSSDGPGPFSLGASPQSESPVTVHVDDLRVWRRLLTESHWSALYDDRAAPSAWRNNAFAFDERLNPEIGVWNADPDGDGRTNLAEFALGSDPWRADAPSLNTGNESVSLFQVTGGRGDVLSAYQVQGVRSVLEMSEDLTANSWQAVDADSGKIVSINYAEDGTHTVHWQPDFGSKPRFYRLRYTLN